jgi:excisionase family DNA binding protein
VWRPSRWSTPRSAEVLAQDGFTIFVSHHAMSDIQPLTMSTRQAAAFLGVGRNKILRLLQTKRIKAKDLDGRLRFTTESLREFLDALPDALEAERQAPHAYEAHRRRR